LLVEALVVVKMGLPVLEVAQAGLEQVQLCQ
jgi:hypothetical protein